MYLKQWVKSCSIWILLLPLVGLSLTLPSIIYASLLFLKTWPNHGFPLPNRVRYLSQFTLLRTSSLVTLSSLLIFSILLHIHTSKAYDRMMRGRVSAYFWFSKWRPSAILAFRIFAIFVKNSNLRLHLSGAKFGEDRTLRSRVIVYFWFSKWRPSAILDFYISTFFVKNSNLHLYLRRRAKFGKDQTIPSVAKLLRIFDFQNGGSQPSWIRYDVIVDHPWLVFNGPNIFQKSARWSCLYFVRYCNFYIWPIWLKLPIHAHFGGVLRGYDGFPLELGIGDRGHKTTVMGLPDGWKSLKIGLAVLIQYRRVTRQTPSHQASHIALAKTALMYRSRS